MSFTAGQNIGHNYRVNPLFLDTGITKRKFRIDGAFPCQPFASSFFATDAVDFGY